MVGANVITPAISDQTNTRKSLKVLQSNTFKDFLVFVLSAKLCKLLVKSAASTFNFGLLNIRQLLANRLSLG